MSFPQGINFRATGGFVTDASGDAYEIGTTANYPRTSPQGNTVGWEDAITGTRDRAAQDAKLSGVHFLTSSAGVTARFRLDLPAAGSYDFRLAVGDQAGQAFGKVELFDNTTSLGILVNKAGAPTATGNNFFDAAGAEHSYASWLTSNAAVSKTFASTICRFKLGAGVGVNETIAHIRVAVTGAGVDASAPGATLTATASIAPGAATGGAAGAAPGATLTATSSIVGGAATAINIGTLTTHIIWNNTRTPMANETGVVLNIYNAGTGTLVVRKSGVTTDSAGVAVVTDALIAAGTSYAYEVVLTGARRRLPVKVAT